MRGHRPPAWALVLAAGAASAALCLLLEAPRLESALHLASYTVSAVLVGCIWWTSRACKPDGLLRFGVFAFILFAVANVASAVMTLMGVSYTSPNAADVMFLLSYLLFAIFFVGLGRRASSLDGRDWLDPCIVVLGVSPLFFLVLVEPVIGRTPNLQLATYLAYPALVFVLLAMMVRLAFIVFRVSPPHLLLGGWICLELVADVGYMEVSAAGTYEGGQWYQAVWVLSATCVGALALHPGARAIFERRQARPISGRGRLILLGTFLALPIVTLAYATMTGGQEAAVLLTAAVALVLVALTCLRLATLMIDNTEQRRIQVELRELSRDLSFQSLHDALTGLGNRALFADRLEHALNQRIVEADRGAAVLLLDLDDFKTINDTFGHDAGDRVLVEVARRLEVVTRRADSVFRLGGDEFAFVVANAQLDDVLRLADRICVALAEPYELGPRQIHLLASQGISIALRAQDRVKLLAEADLAMYDAKTRNTGDPTVFDSDLHEQALARHQLERDLRVAAVKGQLRLLYQPVVELATNEMIGVEALLRWEHPDRGVISPIEFIPLAEVTGAILDIGDWVLLEACRQGLEWDLARPDRPLRVSVNVSPRQLADPQYVQRTRLILSQTGIDRARVTLEVTETAFATDSETMISRLHELKALGVTLAIDDFGTGYSSLSQLRRLPVDIIKIDKSFVDGIAREQPEWELTTAIIRLARGLGKTTLAEGIETGGQLAHLRSLDVELGQGYLFARPVASSAITDLLHALPGRAFLHG